MSFVKRLEELKKRLLPSETLHVILVEKYLGVTEAKAIGKYKADNNIKEFNKEPFLLIFTDEANNVE